MIMAYSLLRIFRSDLHNYLVTPHFRDAMMYLRVVRAVDNWGEMVVKKGAASLDGCVESF